MNDNKIETVKNISQFLGLLFIINLFAGIVILIVTYSGNDEAGILPFLETAGSWIVSFILWRFADNVQSTLRHLIATKENVDFGKEKEMLDHYPDSKNL